MNLATKFWIIICLFLFGLLVFKTFDYSSYLKIRSHQTDNKFLNITFLICYKIELKKDHCSVSSDHSRPKDEFDCEFKLPISCYTKGLNKRTPKELINLFKNCNLRNLTEINLLSDDKKNPKPCSFLIEDTELIIFFDQICLKLLYVFDTTLTKDRATFEFINKHKLPFSVKASIGYDTGLSTSFIPLFKRYCYDNGRNRLLCNMISEQSVIELKIYEFEKIKDNQINKCSYLNDENKLNLIWSCVKNKSLNYDLIYNESDNQILTFYENSSNYYIECLKLFNLSSCNQIELKRTFYTRTKSKSNNIEFVLFIDKRPYKSEFVLQMNKAFEIWITLFCLLFGLNIMDLIKIILSFLLTGSISKYRKLLIFTFISLYLILIVCLQVFNILNVDFQAGKNRQIQKPMLENDNLTIYICFIHEKILKYEENCFQKNQICTLKQKMDSLWNKTDFLKNTEITVQSEYIPFDESDLTEYYYLGYKCFKYRLQRPTLIFFGALMRNVRLEINLKVEYSYYFVFPDDQLPMFEQRAKEYLLYKKMIYYVAENRPCTKDIKTEYGCMDQNDCQANCLINEYARNRSYLPAFIGINPDELLNKSYFNLPIIDMTKNNRFKYFPNCQIQIPENCIKYKIEQFVEKTSNKTQIRINLNPDLTIRMKIEKYSLIATLFEQLPMIFIWFHFSIHKLIKYLTRFLKKYSNQNLDKFINLILFIVFIIQSKVILNLIIYQDLDVKIYSNYAEKISLPKLQFCIELDFNVDLKTGNQLEKQTPNASNLFDELLFLDDDLSLRDLLNSKELDQLIKTFYFENSKCIELNLINFYVKSDIVKAKVASSVLDITINHKLIEGISNRINTFVQAYNFLNFNQAIPIKQNTFYTISYTTVKLIKNDRFLFLKNPSLLMNFLLNKNTRNEQHDYFKYLQTIFYEETKLTTTYLPLDSKLFHAVIDNKQFLDFIHLRTLSSVLNDWTLDANSESEYYTFNYMNENLESTKKVNRKNLSQIALHPNLMIDYYVEENKFDLLIVILNLLSLTVFWLDLNLIKLPSFFVCSFELGLKCLKDLVNIVIWFALNLKSLYQKIINFLRCREEAL